MTDSAKAIKLANDLRKDLGLEERAVDLPRLVEEMGLEVRLENLPPGIEGLTSDQEIVLDPSPGERRRRFTLAHELGHHLLGHGRVSCSAATIHGQPSDPREGEANTFAAALLMPARLFRADAKKLHPQFDEIDDLAATYCVSLTAASIRYVRFARDLCALVGLREGDNPWFLKSWDHGWYLALPPGEGTLVRSHLGVGSGTSTAPIPARAWFENYGWEAEIMIREEVIQTSESSWLVLLSEIPDYDDDPDLVDREAIAVLERRRLSFRRY